MIFFIFSNFIKEALHNFSLIPMVLPPTHTHTNIELFIPLEVYVRILIAYPILLSISLHLHKIYHFFPGAILWSQLHKLATLLWLPLMREYFYGFNMPSHCLVHVHLLHCVRVWLCNGYTQAYVQVIQHTHTHKGVTVHVEVRCYSLVKGN